jgi:hypothetical protein
MFSSFHTQQLEHAVLHGCVTLLLNPMLYVGSFLAVWELLRNAKAERKFFGIRLTKVRGPILRQLVLGIVVGLVLSVLLSVAGAMVTEREIWVVTVISLLLALIRVRFFQIQYAVGLLTLCHVAIRYIHLPHMAFLPAVSSFLREFHSASWLAVASGAGLASAVLLRLNRRTGAAPAVVLGKRGGTMGAFVVQLSFLSAVFLPVPGSDVVLEKMNTGWPWLASAVGGLSLACIPLFTGISALLTSQRPMEGIRRVARWNLLTGLLLAGCAGLTVRLDVVGSCVGAMLCIGIQELLSWWIERREQRRESLFSASKLGVKVLDTIRGSVAHAMGLLPGEVITHVNQVPVHSTYDLHFAFEQNPVYAKLQVLDLRGEVRFVGKPVYEGERHQLGIIFAPDTNGGFGYHWMKAGLFQSLYLHILPATQTREVWSDTGARMSGETP